MIIGELVSADGGTRHKCSRKCRLLPESDRLNIIAYIEKRISNKKTGFVIMISLRKYLKI